MSTNITEKEERLSDRPAGAGLQAGTIGPSRIREDEPTLARTLGMIGAALVIFGGMALGFNLYGKSVRVSTGWAILLLACGLAGLLFHAAFDRDVQFRRMYLAFGAAALLLGAVLCVLPYPNKTGDLFRYGVVFLILALLFILAFLRNETEDRVRDLAELVLGGAGALMAIIGLIGGNVRGEFLLPIGLVLSILGLVYLAAFVATRGLSNNLAYYAAIALSCVGLLLIVVSLGRGLFAPTGSTYFTSYGALLLVVGLLYLGTGGGLASEAPLFVLTRRELGSFFFSPMAYLVLVGFSVLAAAPFHFFLQQILTADGRGAFEPVVQGYFFAFFPVVAVIFMVPVLTMRLLSEEQRTGTLEVLLTAPVDEATIVLSKFLAALITYLVVWMPFGLYLLTIPLAGGNPFDYRPLISFLAATLVTGSAFIAMGLFFSSLTNNQVASGVLTFSGMMLLTAVHWFSDPNAEESRLQKVLVHISYIHLWGNTLEGKITPVFMLFPLSMCILFLFLTVKVLESRKWR